MKGAKIDLGKSENHFLKRSGWLRASVLGANDGILSTTSLAIGVAAASVARDPIILATLAGVVAGAFPIWVLNPISCFIRNTGSKSWRFYNRQICIENLYLGYDCYGNVSVNRVFIWSEHALDYVLAENV